MANTLPPVDRATLILAGGLARRMGGGDKPLLTLQGQPLLAHARRALADDAPLALSANGDAARFAAFALPVLPDLDDTRPGPLGGVLAGMAWAEGLGAKTLLTAPGDCPFLPPDLAARLAAARPEQGAAFARSNGRDHPTIALWPVSARAALAGYLASGERRVMAFLASLDAVAVEWPTTPRDPFFNINTPEDLARAQAIVQPAQPGNTEASGAAS